MVGTGKTTELWRPSHSASTFKSTFLFPVFAESNRAQASHDRAPRLDVEPDKDLDDVWRKAKRLARTCRVRRTHRLRDWGREGRGGQKLHEKNYFIVVSSLRLIGFFKKWANLASFIFGLFKQTIQFLQQMNVKQCHVHPVNGARIQTHDLWNMSLFPKPPDQ